MAGVTLLVPAYRPPPALLQLCGAVIDPVISWVVVDDGSGPEFSSIFREVAARGATVLRHAENRGKGAALKTGFRHVLTACPASGGIVTADADGQHAPEDVQAVARALAARPAALVLGVRDLAAAPWRSRCGNAAIRRVLRGVAGRDFKDTQTGLRGWPLAYCAACLPVENNGYGFELACLMQAAPLPLIQLPIRTIYEPGNPCSHFRPVLDSLRVLGALWRRK